MTDILRTRCPYCQTAFKISQAQINAARGAVRCGVCYKTFNASNNLEPTQPPKSPHFLDDFSMVEEPQRSGEPQLGEEPQRGGEPQRDREPQLGEEPNKKPQPNEAQAVPNHHILSNNQGAAANNSKSPPTPQAFYSPSLAAITSSEDNIEMEASDMAHWRPDSKGLIDAETLKVSPPSPWRWLWRIGSALGIILLACQLLYFNSLSIPRNSTLWPMASFFCGQLHCPLQDKIDKNLIVSRDLLIRTHPSIAKALFVDAVIINNAAFAQPFPPLTLLFESLQGQIVARRTFTPQEYLTGVLSTKLIMPSNRPIKLELEIVDPGKEAVSFHLLIKK